VRVLWILGVLAATAASTADAAEWRYCYGADRPGHRFYLSAPFRTSEPMIRIELDFQRRLIAEGLGEIHTGCPRAADKAGILALMREAERFNREEGNRLFALDWPEAEPVASR